MPIHVTMFDMRALGDTRDVAFESNSAVVLESDGRKLECYSFPFNRRCGRPAMAQTGHQINVFVTGSRPCGPTAETVSTDP
jgi:hypothetical protein